MKKSFYKRVVYGTKTHLSADLLRERKFLCLNRANTKWAKRQVNKAERRKLSEYVRRELWAEFG